MKYYKLFITICILNYGCYSLIHSESKNFFKFDTVLHYSMNDNIDDVQRNSEVFNQLYYGKYPDSIDDTLIISKLEKVGYVYKILSLDKKNNINNIFSETKIKRKGYTSMCYPLYRDILVFKKEEKIIGIAKLCFECEKTSIIGTNLNTISFNTPKTLKKLYKILYDKKFER